ncbi:MAG: hypothetical protein MJA82_06335 [Clostridia bacterium]|nr:hypothetical protein [Clostridia bacterium]
MFKTYIFRVVLKGTEHEEEVEIEMNGDETEDVENAIVEETYREWLNGEIIDSYWYEKNSKPIVKMKNINE